MHTDRTPSRNKSDFNAPKSITCSSTSLPSGRDLPSVVLGTALVHMRDRSGSLNTVRTLVDSTLQISGNTDACANCLDFRYMHWTAPLTGLSGVPVVDVKRRVDCEIQPRFSEELILTCSAWVLRS